MSAPELGFRLAWTSNALMWSVCARRLLRSSHFAEVQLGYVAAYLAINHASRLVDGAHGMRGDELARVQSPIDRKLLRRWRDRLEKVRDAILHLGDDPSKGRHVSVSWKRDPPTLILTASVGRRNPAPEDSISREEIEHLLDELEPWLSAHFDRFRQEERSVGKPPVSA